MTTLRRVVAIVAFASVGVLTMPTVSADAAALRPAPGYWLAGADGGVFSFGAPFHGSGTAAAATCGFSPQAPSMLNAMLGCDAIASTPNGNGYWLLNAYRWATAFGRAGQPDQSGCRGLNAAKGSWTGIASSPTGKGFFLVSSNGGVVGCGDAIPVGGLTARPLNAPVVGIAATPDGKGYWLVVADGGVFSFGDAQFYGSMGGRRLNASVVGMAATPDGKGYWLVASDGGVFSFGDALYYGSTGGTHLNAPVVGMAAAPGGKGYWLAAGTAGCSRSAVLPSRDRWAERP